MSKYHMWKNVILVEISDSIITSRIAGPISADKIIADKCDTCG